MKLLGLTGLVLALPAISLPSLEFPSLGLSALELPSLELPALELPSLELPSLELPSLELPSLERSTFRFLPASPSLPTPPSYKTLPFPKWLSDFTGLHEWPEMDPPYIPLDFISFEKLGPDASRLIHKQGDCGTELQGKHVCLFDCFNCVSSDDVYTCPVLSQTFDDGPSPQTPRLTEQLRSRSTFFTIGVNVVKYPDVYRATAKAGHIMGSHTWSHKFLPGLSNEEIVAQIEWSVWAMNATYGHIPKWFRPPYGGIDNRIRGILQQFGMQAVLWDFDTVDWKLAGLLAPLESLIYAGLAEFQKSRGNRGLILEHDATELTVNMAINVHRQIGPVQLLVPECVGGIDYIKVFPRAET